MRRESAVSGRDFDPLASCIASQQPRPRVRDEDVHDGSRIGRSRMPLSGTASVWGTPKPARDDQGWVSRNRVRRREGGGRSGGRVNPSTFGTAARLAPASPFPATRGQADRATAHRPDTLEEQPRKDSRTAGRIAAMQFVAPNVAPNLKLIPRARVIPHNPLKNWCAR